MIHLGQRVKQADISPAQRTEQPFPYRLCTAAVGDGIPHDHDLFASKHNFLTFPDFAVLFRTDYLYYSIYRNGFPGKIIRKIRRFS